MARRPRIEFKGAIYHIVNRGDRREAIFNDDADRQTFITTLGEACSKTGWIVHAFCLLTDHFHVVVETPNANLVTGMKWFLGTYTRRFNVRHKVSGHLFAGRYRAQLIEPTTTLLRTTCDYVHLNPARAGITRQTDPLRGYPWSSLVSFLHQDSPKYNWLKSPDDAVSSRDAPNQETILESRLEKFRREPPPEHTQIRRAWCIGTEGFRRSVANLLRDHLGEHHFGPEVRASEEAQAERIIAQELQLRDWNENELKRRRKGDAEKLQIAKRLRVESTMTLAWIASRLVMGARTYLAHMIYWDGKIKPSRKASKFERTIPIEIDQPNSTEATKLLTDPSIDRTRFD